MTLNGWVIGVEKYRPSNRYNSQKNSQQTSKLNSLHRDNSKLSINSLCSPSSASVISTASAASAISGGSGVSGLSIMTDSNCTSSSMNSKLTGSVSVTGSFSSISSSTRKKKISFDGAMKKIVNETDAKVEEFEKWMLGLSVSFKIDLELI